MAYQITGADGVPPPHTSIVLDLKMNGISERLEICPHCGENSQFVKERLDVKLFGKLPISRETFFICKNCKRLSQRDGTISRVAFLIMMILFLPFLILPIVGFILAGWAIPDLPLKQRLAIITISTGLLACTLYILLKTIKKYRNIASRNGLIPSDYKKDVV